MENEMSIDQPPATPAKPKTKGGWRKKGARAVPRAGVAMTSAQVAEIAAQVAQIMSHVPADAPRRIVPPRVVQMGQAPPGTGPRNHPKLNNKISRVYEPLPIEP
jgi:hypothetical protein